MRIFKTSSGVLPCKMKEGDEIHFNTGDKFFKYRIAKNHLVYVGGIFNDVIFEHLEINKEVFCNEAYGYKSPGGEFPAYKPGDLKAAKRVIVKLLEICENKKRLYNINRMPKYFAVKEHKDHPRWDEFISWLRETYGSTVNGTANGAHYGNIWVNQHVKMHYRDKHKGINSHNKLLTVDDWYRLTHKQTSVSFTTSDTSTQKTTKTKDTHEQIKGKVLNLQRKNQSIRTGKRITGTALPDRRCRRASSCRHKGYSPRVIRS